MQLLKMIKLTHLKPSKYPTKLIEKAVPGFAPARRPFGSNPTRTNTNSTSIGASNYVPIPLIYIFSFISIGLIFL